MDVEGIRNDFPILARQVHGKPLVYLDSAATSQKPRQVLETLREYYEEYNSNVHRGIHALAEKATERYEAARERVARFIGAAGPQNIIFTRNTTEAINLVAYAWARPRLHEGDEILLTPMEHHSNLIPWQLVARSTGARLRYVQLTPDGRIDWTSFLALLGPKTRLVAVTHVSNVLGTINPVREMVAAAHRVGALVLVDGAQSVPHMPVDVRELDCDFLAFSGHKMLAPTGIGVLYGKEEVLEEMEPFLGGGEMIGEVTLESATWRELPWKFEAGTPNIAGAIALAAACDYLDALGREEVYRHGLELAEYALRRLQEIDGVTLYGPGPGVARGALVAFTMKGIHPHDISTILDQDGIAIRAGHHCAQPLHRWLNVPATARASFYIYNTCGDIDSLVQSLYRAREYFEYVLR
ncbi:MAG: cysteine desulfurase [Limnochordales bacterium]|nr:cysteine desulfurase [Limnochordales bacterium]